MRPFRLSPGLLRIGMFGAVGVVLALVFASYMSPHLMVDLANRLWACF
jgi:hypothetical protein